MSFGALDGAEAFDQGLAVGQVECRDRLVAEQEPRPGASARASPTRCRSPPESVTGRRSSKCSTPQSAATSASRDSPSRRRLFP